MSIEKLYPQAVFAVASSNAGAAVDVEEGRADAAITTGLAAELHGLTVLADGVADAEDAVTRFLLVGAPRRRPHPPAATARPSSSACPTNPAA